MIAWNYIINVVGINNVTIGELSDSYENLFTPASYAFSIWGLIFLGLIIYSVYLVYVAFKKDHRHQDKIIKSAPYIISANILNSLWSYLFLSELTGWSIVVMFGILISLIIAVVQLDMERYDADFPTIAFIWWPISFYIGWITVAAVANVSAHLGRVGFDTIAFGDYTWTMIMITVATLINLLMIKYRNMREFGLVGIWALIAIGARHYEVENELSILAFTCAGLIFIAVIVHGYQKRATAPHIKFKQWREN